VLGGIGAGNQWFDPSVFSAPPDNTFGNVPRNGLLDGPSAVSLDASLAKWFTLKGEARAEFRVDAFNLTNRPQFQLQDVNGEFGNPRFGQVTSTRPDTERVVSFVLRLVF
jgi:hypothetical protein